MPPKFGELRSRNDQSNGGERLASFCPPLNFRIGRHCQPYRIDVTYITARQQATFDTRYVVERAYRLEQQNARRAQAGLCHASTSSSTVSNASNYRYVLNVFYCPSERSEQLCKVHCIGYKPSVMASNCY